MSKRGKEVLIKVVVQAIPTYTMACFKIPITVCKEIKSMMRKFWWGSQDDKQKIHWVSWEKLCWPKVAGGLGFRDLKTFNVAMLAKQGWKIIHNPESLVARVLKAHYFPHGSFREANYGINPSYTWRSLMQGKEVFEARLVWRISDISRYTSGHPNVVPTQLQYVYQLITEDPKC